MRTNRPATLSSALLARKGSAAPTGYTPIRPEDVITATSAFENSGTRHSGGPRPVMAPVPESANGPTSIDGERARVSVRLDRDRHLKLRLTAAHLDHSLQDIMTDALDRYLEQISPEILRNSCACLGVAAPRGWQPK
ncbi:MAG: hypothetical protein GKS02_14245 [Alphaproteobacteria bacterium]|nr:hypothetical protein [Alphaproteobacteria bacterium]